MGVTEYEPRVLHQLLEFLHRYCTEVFHEGHLYAEHAGRSQLECEDVQLALRLKAAASQTGAASLIEWMARERNREPLPPAPQGDDAVAVDVLEGCSKVLAQLREVRLDAQVERRVEEVEGELGGGDGSLVLQEGLVGALREGPEPCRTPQVDLVRPGPDIRSVGRAAGRRSDVAPDLGRRLFIIGRELRRARTLPPIGLVAALPY